MEFLSVNPITAQDSARLALRVDAHQFFQDNEFFGLHAEGYTLPGFVLRPVVEWTVEEGVMKGGRGRWKAVLEAGAHWLHFWGARRYPSAQGLEVWPCESDTATAAHVLPWVRAEVVWRVESGTWRATMGDLHEHRLPLPLYNPERLYAADPEAGVQLTMDTKHFGLDVWVDWREYIWRRSSRQERFTAGLSGEWRTQSGKWGLRVPLHVVGQHIGGQGLAVATPVQNHFNGAAGLLGEWKAEGGKWTVTAGGYAMGYTQKNAPDIPFRRGWGFYPVVSCEFRAKSNELRLDAGYWHSRGFVPLLGSVLFSNVAYVDGITYFGRNRMVNAGIRYTWHSRLTAVSVEGRWYRYFEKEHPSQYTVGVFIDMKPRMTVMSFEL